MKATIIYRNKSVDDDGITQVVIWQLPHKTAERPHGIKYRCYYGDMQGKCVVRYDNETGKGDHKHIRNKEEAYEFSSIEQLMRDFIDDVKLARREM